MTVVSGRGVSPKDSGVLQVATVGCLGALVMWGGVGVASASPTQDPVQATCTYTLSEPSLVETAGRPMVTATLSALPCSGVALPNEQTVCIELQGSGSAPQCKSIPGYATAQVYFAPYRPGSTYVSTGKGCAAVAPSQVSVCATQGPYSATL
jgi:hypothetical protein